MAARYVVMHGPVALVASQTKTVVNLLSSAADVPLLTEIGVSIGDTSTTLTPVRVDLCLSTQGVVGTGTAFTPLQVYGGDTAAPNVTALVNYSVEPTTLTPIRSWYVNPASGLLVIQFPLGREPTPRVSGATGGNLYKALALRLTTGAATTSPAVAYMEYEE